MPPKRHKGKAGFAGIMLKWGAVLALCALGLVSLVGRSETIEKPTDSGAALRQPSIQQDPRPPPVGSAPSAGLPQQDPRPPPGVDPEPFPQVAASIALHPPKFHHVAHLLSEYAVCPAAQKAMSICLVFSDTEEEALFKKGLGILYPGVQDSHYMSVVADVNSDAFFESLKIPSTNAKQVVAAWKKWFGIAHLMDLGERTPQYGLMLDAEVALFDRSDCGANSNWGSFFKRVRAKDAAKLWPTAQLSKTIKMEPIGGGQFRTGFGHGQGILKGNADFITHGGLNSRQGIIKDCKTDPCLEVNKQIELGLFTWWTDLPYVNLETAKRMLQSLNKDGCPKCYPAAAQGPGFKQLLKGIRFPRFEYICYQMWCILHEGWHLWDLTNYTGMAKWGSFLEDPQGKDADLTISEPLWVSAECIVKEEKRQIKRFSTSAPPVLAFHIDHNNGRFGASKWQTQWKLQVPGFEAYVAFATREHNTAHGEGLGEDIVQEPYTGQTLDQCKQRCLEDKRCHCVTHGRKERKYVGDCWLLARCKFKEDFAWNTYIKNQLIGDASFFR